MHTYTHTYRKTYREASEKKIEINRERKKIQITSFLTEKKTAQPNTIHNAEQQI